MLNKSRIAAIGKHKQALGLCLEASQQRKTPGCSSGFARWYVFSGAGPGDNMRIGNNVIPVPQSTCYNGPVQGGCSMAGSVG